MEWLFLVSAMLGGITATLALKVAARGRSGAYVIVVAGYLIAFTNLSLALRNGLDLGVGYGLWAAGGVALTAAASHLLFGEPITRMMVIGIGLVIAGVLLLEVAIAR